MTRSLRPLTQVLRLARSGCAHLLRPAASTRIDPATTPTATPAHLAEIAAIRAVAAHALSGPDTSAAAKALFVAEPFLIAGAATHGALQGAEQAAARTAEHAEDHRPALPPAPTTKGR